MQCADTRCAGVRQGTCSPCHPHTRVVPLLVHLARLEVTFPAVQHAMALVEGPLTTQEIHSIEFGLSWFFIDKAFRQELVDFFLISQWDQASGCLLVHCLSLVSTGLDSHDGLAPEAIAACRMLSSGTEWVALAEGHIGSCRMCSGSTSRRNHVQEGAGW